jgi:hypothetical protein
MSVTKCAPKIQNDYPESSLTQVSGLLHRFPSRRKFIAMLVAYLDESGIHSGSKICAVAGFVGAEEEWVVFERRWKQVLKRAGISAFHMVEFESRRNEFEGWSDTRRKMLLSELIEVIKAREVFGFGSALVMAEYQKLNEADRAWMTHNNPESPYFLCLQECAVAAAHYADGLPPEERVALVFDRQSEFAGEATRLYNDLKDEVTWPNRVRLSDAIAFGSRKELAPLQAADIAAYESYKRMENLIYNPQHAERWPLKQLRMRPFRGKYFDGPQFQELLLHRPM